MTIRPIHYARLLIEGSDSVLVAARIESLTALTEVERELERVMALPSMHPRVTTILTDANVDKLTRAIVVELAISGRLSWLPTIVRITEQLAAAGRTTAVAHLSLAHADTTESTAVATAFGSSLGTVGTVRTTVNEHQLGGLILQVADRRLDTSLHRRLRILKAALTKGTYE